MRNLADHAERNTEKMMRQHNTTNKQQTDRRTYLKALGAGALAAGMAGIAGCLGAEAEGNNGSNSDGGSTTAGTGAQGGGTKTNASTDAEGDEGSGELVSTSSADGDTTTNGTGAAQSNGGESTNECVDSGAVDTSGFETYTNTEDGYSIAHPIDLEIKDEFAFETTESVEITGEQFGSVVVEIEEASGKTPEALGEAYVQNLKQAGEDVELLCQRDVGLSSGQTGKFVEVKDRLSTHMALFVLSEKRTYTIEAGWTPGALVADDTPQISAAIIESFAIEED